MSFPKAKKGFEYNRTVCGVPLCDETGKHRMDGNIVCEKRRQRIKKYGDPHIRHGKREGVSL